MKCGLYGDTMLLVSSGFCGNLFTTSGLYLYHAFDRVYARQISERLYHAHREHNLQLHP